MDIMSATQSAALIAAGCPTYILLQSWLTGMSSVLTCVPDACAPSKNHALNQDASRNFLSDSAGVSLLANTDAPATSTVAPASTAL